MKTRVLASVLCIGTCLAIGCSPAGGADAPTVRADKVTGTIAVETDRYKARFEGGTLVYLHNKLKNRTMIDVALDPELPVGQRTALYVADKPKTEPFWIYPATEGEGRAAVTVAQQGADSVAVTFKGLVTDPHDKEQRRFPDAELTVTVAVEPKSGHLLVTTAGRSPDTLVVGSAFAYAGLMTRSYNYTTASSGLRQFIDLKSKEGRRDSVLEWANMNHGKRLGLRGGLWPAAVTVQAAADDPNASFAVWAEDDAPRSKYLIEQGKDNAYVTYEMPPYDDNRQAESVVWRVNVFQGGWTAAATPFADSLKRRGYVDGRASWREDISLMIFAAPGRTWTKAMEAAFPPEVRHRILIWLPQAWRTLTNTRDAKTTDAYYWDNNFSEQGAKEIREAVEAGFRVSGYTNPHYQWGSWKQVIDPETQEIVRGFSELPMICPVAQEASGHGGHSLAYTPYREHMLRTYKHIFDNLDMSLYMDTTHQIPLDGRGTAVCGMSSYEGALTFFRGARALKREQFIGMEFLTELGVMGLCGDYGLFYDLVWSRGWERYKAANTHPILSYLYRDTSLQVSQRVAPWSYGGPRYYHLLEEISERIGTIATSEWSFQNISPEGKLTTPEERQWFDKIQLYVRRGLRPQFPEQWEEGVMSYLKASDGAVFKYIETGFGSEFVEFPRGGKPVLHYARAWKTPVVKAGNGYLHDWIGVADNGDFIGLDNAARGYCLFATPDASAAHLRLNALPETLAILRAKVEPDLAVVELGPRDRKQEKPAIGGPVEGTIGKPATPIAGTISLVTDRPLVRVAAAHQPVPRLQATGQADGQYRYDLTGEFWGELAFIWREGVYAPFEPSDDYLLPMTVAPPAEPGEYFVVLQPFDQRWNAEIAGPRNPRPGTVYEVTVTAAATDGQPGTLALFLTQPSTKGSKLFADTFGAKHDGGEPQALQFAGVRKPEMDVVGVRDLALRSFLMGEKNVRIADVTPVRFIRPTLAISSIEPMDLGQVGKGAAAASPPREVLNSQKATVSAAGKTFASILYGTANITVPDANRPHMQQIDHVGVVLVGKDAGLFSLVGEHRSAESGIVLVGADGEPGLRGGENQEKETFSVRFNGSDRPGTYVAAVRIVTQAGNIGTVSTGMEGEPLKNIRYVDIPVSVTVK